MARYKDVHYKFFDMVRSYEAGNTSVFNEILNNIDINEETMRAYKVTYSKIGETYIILDAKTANDDIDFNGKILLRMWTISGYYNSFLQKQIYFVFNNELYSLSEIDHKASRNGTTYLCEVEKYEGTYPENLFDERFRTTPEFMENPSSLYTLPVNMPKNSNIIAATIEAVNKKGNGISRKRISN